MKELFRIQILAILAMLVSTGIASAQDIVQTDSLAVLTFEIKEPKTKSNQNFIDVIQKMGEVRSRLLGSGAEIVRQHPRAGVHCNTCHTTGKFAGHDMSINVAVPSASCTGSGCHNLEKAGKMPFYAKGYVSLTNLEKLPRAQQLLESAPDILTDLDDILTDLPEFGDVKVSAELAGRGQQNTLGEAGRFSHARSADLLPGYAVAKLADGVLGFPDQVSEKTKLEVKLEVRTRYARHLSEHLRLQVLLADVLDYDQDPEIVELEIKDEYKPPLDQDLSLAALQQLIGNSFRSATVTKDETKTKERKYEWRDGKTEINFEWKESDKTKIEFKKLLPQDEAKAMGVLNAIALQLKTKPSKREIKPKFEKVERLLKDTKLELRYPPEVLPLDALTLLKAEVQAHFPEALFKKEEDTKIEWEIPGKPKGEIKADFKDKETKIEFKNLDLALHDEAIRVLSAVQEAFAVPAQFARYEFKFEAVTEDKKTELQAALENLEPSVRGDLELQIKEKEDSKGTPPADWRTPGRTYIDKDSASLRLISTEVKLKKELRFKELKSSLVSSRVDAPVALANELIARVYEFALSRPLENAYLANLKKVPEFILARRLTPATNQVNAFIGKVESDLAKKRIAEVDGFQLLELALELRAVLTE
ncbi:MAG: hypothetical protein EA400_14050 [Chromatiaceae bacterium]|nr:MAG: hypothetical protein EA400_14050 [Chromatiaceae bacterium]